MLRICDIHNLREMMAELSSDAWERKEIPPAYWEHKIIVKILQNGIARTTISGNKFWTVSNLKSFLQVLHSMKQKEQWMEGFVSSLDIGLALYKPDTST